MDSGITALPLTDFLADPVSGRIVLDRLHSLLGEHKRILVWGPRVGAIELAEDLLMLWPNEGEIVAVNAGALCTRTRQDTQDSEWVQWVETDALTLLEETMDRKPKGIVVLYANQTIGPALPKLLDGTWGFVTAVDASSAAEAREKFARLAGKEAERLDVMIGLSEAGKSTFISEVTSVAGGASQRVVGLDHGKYVT